MLLLIALGMLVTLTWFTAIIVFVSLLSSVYTKLYSKWPHKDDSPEYRNTFWKSYFMKALTEQLPVLWIVFLLFLLATILGLFWHSLIQPKSWLPFLDWLVAYLSTIWGV